MWWVVKGGSQGGVEDKTGICRGPGGRMCHVEEFHKLCLRGRPRILLRAEKEQRGSHERSGS